MNAQTLEARILRPLARRRALFHSEADLQHELAWSLREAGLAEAIRLERPFSTPAGVMNLDLFASGSSRTAIELKYWKKALSLDVGNESFQLKNQGAHDISRYDFWKDVWRLETMVDLGVAERGFAIALTNDPGYWRPGRGGTIDVAFRLHEGRTVEGELAWSERAGKGTTRNREKPLALRSRYTVRWKDYSEPTSGVAFRYLLLEVQPRTSV